MTIQPTVSGPEQVVAANPPSSLKVQLWYLLAVLLPFTLAVFAPYPVGQARSYPYPGAPDWWRKVADLPAMIATGWGLVAVGLVGVLVGTFAFSGRRRNGDKAARRWNVAAWSLAVIVGLFGQLATSVVTSGHTPPRDAAVSSAAVPVGAVVQSTSGGGSFRVEVVSIKCDWFSCSVSTTITNTGTEVGQFPCYDLAAWDSTGMVFKGVKSSFVVYYGCEPPTLQVGESASVDVELYDVYDRELVGIIVPGADEQIDLPGVNR